MSHKALSNVSLRAAQTDEALGSPQTGLFFVTRARMPQGEPNAATWVLPGVNKPVNWSWQVRDVADYGVIGFGDAVLFWV